MQCDICGKQEAEFTAEIEGTEMKVCNGCSGYGTNAKKIKKDIPQVKETVSTYRPERQEPVELIVDNYAQIVKKARESMNLKQEDFAKRINEKESVIHSIESGHREPRIELAKKLEKFLNVRLVEVRAEKDLHLKTQVTESGDLTVGDMIKIKHRKK